MKTRNKAVPAVYAILRKGNKVLLARRFNTGYMDGQYSLPAGHVELGESPKQSLIRETKEEVGVDVKEMQFIHFLYRQKKDETGDRVDLFFKVEKWDGEPTIMEPEKCDDLKWADIDDLPDTTIPYIRRVLELSEKGIVFDED